jgi:hypothetical protein
MPLAGKAAGATLTADRPVFLAEAEIIKATVGIWSNLL